MPTDKQLDQTISRWLEAEAPTQLPDRVLRATFERTRQTRQQGRWRALLGRMHANRSMSKFVSLGLGAAAVVVALVVGAQLLGPPAPSGVGGAPTAQPSAAPSPTADGGLPEGPFTIVDEGAKNSPVRTTVTIPAPGWISLPEIGGLLKGEDADPPEASLLAWSWPAGDPFYVYGDPCQWKSTTPDTPATTVDEIVAALAAQASRAASTPVDVTVGGNAGKAITLHVPNDAPTRAEAFKDCDGDKFASYGLKFSQGGPYRYHQGPGQIDELWILDVGGAIVIIDAMYRPNTPAELVDELRAIAESATFE